MGLNCFPMLSMLCSFHAFTSYGGILSRSQICVLCWNVPLIVSKVLHPSFWMLWKEEVLQGHDVCFLNSENFFFFSPVIFFFPGYYLNALKSLIRAHEIKSWGNPCVWNRLLLIHHIAVVLRNPWWTSTSSDQTAPKICKLKHSILRGWSKALLSSGEVWAML